MDRRSFLKYMAVGGASFALGDTSACAEWSSNRNKNSIPPDVLLIDAHAHPDIIPCTPSFCDRTSTLKKIKKLGMQASCFAVLGDRGRTDPVAVPFDELLVNLQKVIGLEEQGKIHIVRRHSDVPYSLPLPDFVPGAILAVEGGTPLESDSARIGVLHDYGVRLITPMHYMINEIGDIMTESPVHNGLTQTGRQMVERMMSSGIIVDAAHAHINTLKGMAEMARVNNVPIIDSHTSLIRSENPYGTTRRRTFKEMEMVVETGGVICTWPLAWSGDGNHHRLTFSDWAGENLEIARRFGSEHVGLGTDGGGGLPDLIDGYESILDLPKLAEAMYAVGFHRDEIAAYMGGNFLRVIKHCMK